MSRPPVDAAGVDVDRDRRPAAAMHVDRIAHRLVTEHDRVRRVRRSAPTRASPSPALRWTRSCGWCPSRPSRGRMPACTTVAGPRIVHDDGSTVSPRSARAAASTSPLASRGGDGVAFARGRRSTGSRPGTAAGRRTVEGRGCRRPTRPERRWNAGPRGVWSTPPGAGPLVRRSPVSTSACPDRPRAGSRRAPRAPRGTRARLR